MRKENGHKDFESWLENHLATSPLRFKTMVTENYGFVTDLYSNETFAVKLG